MYYEDSEHLSKWLRIFHRCTFRMYNFTFLQLEHAGCIFRFKRQIVHQLILKPLLSSLQLALDGFDLIWVHKQSSEEKQPGFEPGTAEWEVRMMKRQSTSIYLMANIPASVQTDLISAPVLFGQSRASSSYRMSRSTDIDLKLEGYCSGTLS